MHATSNLETMLRDCKADPTDDHTRYVLADVLEDAGEGERAEFVRLQLAADRDAWDAVKADREARQRRLLRKNVGAWLGGDFRDPYWLTLPGAAEGVTASAKFAG